MKLPVQLPLTVTALQCLNHVSYSFKGN
uniref:Uncharacterized protein n=1 Tax=Anguilla anguilla TaxID=7936 RepID=A0A0E9Q2E6_ANGAN